MAKATIDAGICGYTTTVEAEKLDKFQVKLQIESECPHIQKMAADLQEVNALDEISPRKGNHEIMAKGNQYCTHSACPVPVGIIKAVEVATGLALPKDANIKVEK